MPYLPLKCKDVKLRLITIHVEKRKPEYLATFHIIVLVGYSKPINGLIAATSGACVY